MMTEVTSHEVELKPGATYLAKIHLTGMQSTFGNAKAVEERLEEFGFRPCLVFDAHSVPATFPDRSPFAGGSTYFAQGVWTGPDETRELPQQIKRVWTERPAPEAPAHAQSEEPSEHAQAQGVAAVDVEGAAAPAAPPTVPAPAPAFDLQKAAMWYFGLKWLKFL